MAFADLLAQDGVGVVWMLDISTDDFATVSYRWATGSFVDGSGNRYDGRIKQLGRIGRALGSNNTPAATSFRALIDNSDFGADWLVDRSTFATTVPKSRFRLKLGLFDPTATYAAHPTITTQTMGEFTCLDNPSRDKSMVSLQLADDTLGRIADLAIAPSINDWVADAGSTTANCLFKDGGAGKVGNWDAPSPLAFGSATFPLEPRHLNASQMGGAGDYFGALIVSATTNTGASGDSAIALFAQYHQDIEGVPELAGKTIQIPETFVGASGQVTIWSLQRSGSLSKDGKTWRIQWLKFNLTNYSAWIDATYPAAFMGGPNAGGGTNPFVRLYPTRRPQGVNWNGGMSPRWAAFERFHFSGYPLSARSSSTYMQNAADVLYDLIGYYSKASTSDIDPTSFTAAKAALTMQPVAGVIQAAQPAQSRRQGFAGIERPEAAFGANKLREAIGDICASVDADLFLSWTGTYKLQLLKVSFADFTTTPGSIDETRMRNVEERGPSFGERWAPYNRLFVVLPNGDIAGPYDHPTAVSSWGRVLPRTISARWCVDIDGGEPQTFVWQRRLVEAKHRTILSFETDVSALVYDLGDYVSLTWTRLQGGSTPYSSAIFRVESLAVDPKTMAVSVEAVWMADLQSTLPYLLDDETMVTISSGSGGRTLSVTNGNSQVTASSGSFVSDGVEVGDILLVHDANEPTNGFANDIAVKVTSVDDATHVTASGYTGWSTITGLTNWKVLKGATTYPTSSDDPTNYPSGGTMYGKACSASDLFSDASAANLLRDG